MEQVTIGLALIAGLLSFISPCVLPLVPAYIGYMGARVTHNVALQVAADGSKSKADVTSGQSLLMRFGILMHGITFVAGFTLVFVAFGLMITGIISVAGPARAMLIEIIGRVGGIIIIFFGLHFMGIMPALFKSLRKNPKTLDNVLTTLIIAAVGSMIILWGFVEPIIALPVLAVFVLAIILGGGLTEPGEFWNKLINTIETILYSDTRQQMDASGQSGLGGSFLMGVVFAAGWTPCIGPVYGAVLNLAARTGDVIQAVPLLIAYSLGLGIPFLLTAVLLDQSRGLLRRLNKHMHKIEIASGLLLIFIGILVASGRLQDLSSSLSNQFSDLSFRVEECGVGFFNGELAFNQIGSCVGDTLHPVAYNQSSTTAHITAEIHEIEYVFHGVADETIYVEIRDIDEESALLNPVITLYSPDDEELTRTEGGTIIREDALLTIDGYSLNEDGLHRLTVTSAAPVAGDTELEFRLRVSTTPPEVTLDTSDNDSESQGQDTETPDSDSGSSNQGSASDAVAAAAMAQSQDNTNAIGSIESLAAVSDPVEGLEVGNIAPDFALISDTGEEVSLSNLRGEVVLLNFWGTWCGPCIREMPELQNVFEVRADEGFTIVGIAVNDELKKVQDFREEYALTFTLALDEGDLVSRLYGINTQPSTLIIDRDGIILAKHFGILTADQLEELVGSALSWSG